MQKFIGVNPLNLPSLTLSQRRELPSVAAIYFAISETNKILYIGRSKNLADRWKAHHRYLELEEIGNVRIAWLSCDDESLLPQVEDALIKHFLPPLNNTLISQRQPQRKRHYTDKLIELIKNTRGLMSQRAFGKLLGVSTTAVHSWERGDSVPDTENLEKIAARAGYTLEQLLEYLEGKPLPDSSSRLNQILKQIKYMPLSQVAQIVQAAADRLNAVAEASGEKTKAG